jgi:hypothetical protein
MSLTAFKKKSVINYGSNRSGRGPGGIWIPQGPFGHSTQMLSLSLQSPGYSGFSINGGMRNIGYVAKSSVFSKNFTPFRGAYAKGNGGTLGQYYNRDHVLPSRQVDTLGTQAQYIKPSVVSTHGMLDRKYRWVYYGVYPNNIVSPSGVGNTNLTDNTSQGVYVMNKGIENDCINDVNNFEKYKNHCVNCGSYPYTKTIYQPLTASQYILKIQRKCVNQSVKHFPEKTGNGNSVCAVPLSARLN